MNPSDVPAWLQAGGLLARNRGATPPSGVPVRAPTNPVIGE